MGYSRDEVLTISDVAKYLKISKALAYSYWNGIWREYGLKPLQMSPNGDPRFLKKDLVQVMQRIATQNDKKG